MHVLRPYIMHLKEKELGFLHCEGCGETEGTLDVHHKRYGLDVTMRDLELLCGPCHDKKTFQAPLTQTDFDIAVGGQF